MGGIFVVVEHRRGKVRDITLEMLAKAGDLKKDLGGDLTAVLLGWETGSLIESLKGRADKILVIEDERVNNFEAEVYKLILQHLIQEVHPSLTLIGQTSWGLDLAPCLAVKTGFPLVTDCVELRIEGGRPRALRQMYGGKVFARVAFKESPGYLATIRPGAFPPDPSEDHQTEVIKKQFPAGLPESKKQILELVESEAGEVDIAQAEFLVSVGRGVGEEENLALVRDLARSLGAVLSCSRPIVDKKWLPKYHQVGTSGKSVKPKVYLALGISGAFQHLAGIGGAGTVIAVNKDPKAPIFRAAQYGVAQDIFKIIPALMEQINRN
jgi:electron transfer flavoprotein alpha subunit